MLGEDHFRVGISAECDFSTSEQTEETFDPTRSVMTNSQKSEDLSNRPDSAGVPGTPSNSPRPISRPTTSGSTVSRRTEDVSYQTSRSVHEVKTPRGILKRLSASVLLDQDVRWVGTGSKAKRVVTPPSPEKIKTIHDVVAAIVGLTPTRGDQLVVESLPFEQNRDIEVISQAPPASTQPDQLRKLTSDPKIMIGAGAASLLVVGLAVFLLTRRKKKSVEVNETPARLIAAQAIGDEAAQKEQAQLSAKSQQALQAAAASTQVEALRQNVRESVNRDPGVAASVLRTWIGEAGA